MRKSCPALSFFGWLCTVLISIKLRVLSPPRDQGGVNMKSVSSVSNFGLFHLLRELPKFDPDVATGGQDFADVNFLNQHSMAARFQDQRARTALFGEETSSQSTHEMSNYFRGLFRRDSIDTSWMKVIEQHSKNDVADVGVESPSTSSPPDDFDSSHKKRWRRVYREALHASMHDTIHKQVLDARDKVLDEAKKLTISEKDRAALHAAAENKKEKLHHMSTAAAKREAAEQQEADAAVKVVARSCADEDVAACSTLARKAQSALEMREHAWLNAAAHRARLLKRRRHIQKSSSTSSSTTTSSSSPPSSGRRADGADGRTLWSSALPARLLSSHEKQEDAQHERRQLAADRHTLVALYRQQARVARASAEEEDKEADRLLSSAATEEGLVKECLQASVVACRQLSAEKRGGEEKRGEDWREVRAILVADKIVDGMAACVQTATPHECAAARRAAEMQRKIDALEALRHIKERENASSERAMQASAATVTVGSRGQAEGKAAAGKINGTASMASSSAMHAATEAGAGERGGGGTQSAGQGGAEGGGVHLEQGVRHRRGRTHSSAAGGAGGAGGGVWQWLTGSIFSASSL